MVAIGYTLSSEEHGPDELVDLARRAEEHGFDFVSISDHYHPWISEQGHSPFVWSVLGAIASATDEIGVGVGVTCPTVRIHPAILAQATATTALLFDGRFFWGVGSGEALNEHILGDWWPPADIRLEMLEEAVEVVRKLWTGETVSHRGAYYEVENAKLFDPPTEDPPIIVSAFGPKAAELAARIGDGYWGTSPSPEIIETFEKAGGTGPRYGQMQVCWAEDAADARATVHRIWPNGGITGQLSQDLPTWTHFEDAAEMVTEESATGSLPCGPEVEPYVASVKSYLDAGYDHVYLHQIGPDQEGFFRFWDSELQAALRELAPTETRRAG
jgi:coenzyme F420-dependent glucose-6-phosphate dehydrogenase